MLSNKNALLDKQDGLVGSYQQFPFLNIAPAATSKPATSHITYAPLTPFQTNAYDSSNDLFAANKTSFPLVGAFQNSNPGVSNTFVPKTNLSFPMTNTNQDTSPFTLKQAPEKLKWGNNNYGTASTYQDVVVPNLKLGSFESTHTQNIEQLSMPWIENNSLLDKVKPPTMHDSPNKIIEWFFALEQFYGLSGLWDRYPFQQFPCATLLSLPYEIVIDIWGEMIGSIIYNHLHIGDAAANVSTTSPAKQTIQSTPPIASLPSRPQNCPQPSPQASPTPAETTHNDATSLTFMRSVRPQQRKSSTVSKRLDVVLFAEKFSNKAAARYFNIQPSQVRSYRRQKSQLLQTAPNMRRIGSGRKPVFPDIEEQLFEWIKSEQTEGRPVSIKVVQDQAMAIANDPEKHSGFKASVSWVRNFLRRNDVAL